MKVAIICPASIAKNQDHVTKLENFFKENNINYVIKPSCYSTNKYLGISDEEKVNEIHEVITDESITHIISLKGGYGTARLLDKLDYDLIEKYNKPIVGYSDLTALINTLSVRTNMKCFHGPMGNDLWQNNSFLDLLQHFEMNEVKHNQDLKFINCEKIVGNVVGGNLALISSLVGTDYQIDTTNKYLLIEEIAEEPYKIDRMLNQLRQSKMLENAKGFIISTFTSCDETHNMTYQEVLNEYIYSLEKPILEGYRSGHIKDIHSLPINQKIEINNEQIIYLK